MAIALASLAATYLVFTLHGGDPNKNVHDCVTANDIPIPPSCDAVIRGKREGFISLGYNINSLI